MGYLAEAPSEAERSVLCSVPIGVLPVKTDRSIY